MNCQSGLQPEIIPSQCQEWLSLEFHSLITLHAHNTTHDWEQCACGWELGNEGMMCICWEQYPYIVDCNEIHLCRRWLQLVFIHLGDGYDYSTSMLHVDRELEAWKQAKRQENTGSSCWLHLESQCDTSTRRTTTLAMVILPIYSGNPTNVSPYPQDTPPIPSSILRKSNLFSPFPKPIGLDFLHYSTPKN